MKERLRRAAIIAALLALLLVPIDSVVVPAWSVQIVDTDSRAVEGINVRQVWQHYTLESVSHEEVRVTPSDGRVSFPERRISGTVFMYVVGTVGNFAGVHSSFGPSSQLVIWGRDELRGRATYLPSRPLPDRVVIEK